MSELTPHDEKAFSAVAQWWAAQLPCMPKDGIGDAFANSATPDPRMPAINPEQRQIFTMVLASGLGIDYQDVGGTRMSCGVDKKPDSYIATALSYAGLPENTPLPRRVTTSMEKKDGIWTINIVQANGEREPLSCGAATPTRLAHGRSHLRLVKPLI